MNKMMWCAADVLLTAIPGVHSNKTQIVCKVVLTLEVIWGGVEEGFGAEWGRVGSGLFGECF